MDFYTLYIQVKILLEIIKFIICILHLLSFQTSMNKYTNFIIIRNITPKIFGIINLIKHL